MKTRAALVAAGAALMAYASIGLLVGHSAQPIGIAVFLLAVLVGHDLVWMPVALAAGLLIARGGMVARVAAVIAASIGAVALPLVLGHGQPADNPSVLPLHYGRNLLLILLVIMAAAVVRKKFARPKRPRDE